MTRYVVRYTIDGDELNITYRSIVDAIDIDHAVEQVQTPDINIIEIYDIIHDAVWA